VLLLAGRSYVRAWGNLRWTVWLVAVLPKLTARGGLLANADVALLLLSCLQHVVAWHDPRQRAIILVDEVT
jgi:hypothetical protein